MVTVDPDGAVPPLGFCENTLPGVEPPGPAIVRASTLNPAWLRICWAVAGRVADDARDRARRRWSSRGSPSYPE